MKKLTLFLVVVMLSACGGSNKPKIVNPYTEVARSHATEGVIAMQRERWVFAETLFERSLAAAQLADEPELIINAWYNLGTTRAAMGKRKEAQEAFSQVISMASLHGFPVVQKRAEIGIALLQAAAGEPAMQPDVLSSSLPADLHLAVARLAQYQGRSDVAKEEYRLVLRQAANSRGGMQFKAKAHLGLAMLARAAGDAQKEAVELEDALALCRKAGAPRIAAHALLMKADVLEDDAKRHDALLRALVIYQNLGDIRGQRASLEKLVGLDDGVANEQQAKQYRKALQMLEDGAKQ